MEWYLIFTNCFVIYECNKYVFSRAIIAKERMRRTGHDIFVAPSAATIFAKIAL